MILISKNKAGKGLTVLTAKDEEYKSRWKRRKPTFLYTQVEKDRVLKKIMEIATNTTFEEKKILQVEEKDFQAKR